MYKTKLEILKGMKRIAIIGAGPGGNQAAYKLAQEGFDVTVYEEHEVIGKPVQCTGIVTQPFKELMGNEQSYVVNKIDTIKIFAPDGNAIEFKFKNEDWIIDRTKFDQFLASRAEKEGAKFLTGHHFLDYSKQGELYKLKIKNKSEIIDVEADYIIGADGPMSNVAKKAGLYGERKFFFGVQPIMQLDNKNIIEVYPAKTGFCWITPISPTKVKAGIAAEEQANTQLKEFMTLRFGADYKQKILETEGGLVPVYNPSQKVQEGNVFLVGDASTAAKATTAGGIIQSLIGANCVAAAISEKKNYQKLLNNSLSKEMRISLMMRRMLNKFQDKDYNNLVAWLSAPKAKGLLEEYSRDYPSKFVFKLMMTEPRLLTYVKFLV